VTSRTVQRRTTPVGTDEPDAPPEVIQVWANPIGLTVWNAQWNYGPGGLNSERSVPQPLPSTWHLFGLGTTRGPQRKGEQLSFYISSETGELAWQLV